MEKTIEERADDYAMNDKSIVDFCDVTAVKNGYIKGATDQRKIDIEEAVRWLEDNINKYLFNDNSFGSRRDWLKCSSQAFVDFRKAMEG